MSRSKMFLLGAAAGAAITLFLTSEKGKAIIQELTDKYNDKLADLSGDLKDKTDEFDESIKNNIDRAAGKLAI